MNFWSLKAMIEKYLKKPALIALFIAAVYCIGIVGQPTSSRDQKKANDLVVQGNRSFAQKQYRAAIEKYAESIVIAPKNPVAHYWKGYAHYYLKEFPMAVSELMEAEAEGHPVAEIAKVRWYLHFEAKDYDAALSDVLLGLQTQPRDQMLLRAAGDIYFEKKNYTEALKNYQAAVADAPRDGNLHYKIAVIYNAQGNVQGQEQAAAAAVANPSQFVGDANFLLADALHKQRKFPEAIEAYVKALNSRPDSIEIYRALGDLYRGQSRMNEAIEIMRVALRRWPLDGSLFTDVSWYYSLADRKADAVAAADSAVKLLPNEFMGYTNLCRAYLETEKYMQAITACNSALRLNPNHGESYFYLGRAQKALNRNAEAAKSYDMAVAGLIKFTQDNPDYSDGFYLLGNAYFTDGQYDKAIAAYNRCLTLSPRFARARFNAGISHIQKRDKMQANEQYNALNNIDKDLAAKLKAEIDKM
jgi:tetratricopeptide (TPR) repeat protein